MNKSMKDISNYRIVGSYILTDSDGIIKQEGAIKNLVVTEGDRWICDLLQDTPTKTLFTNAFMVLGTGWVSAAKSDTWVTAWYSGNSKVMDAGYPTAALAVLTFVCTFAAGEATQNSINEAVISEAAAAADGSKSVGKWILSHGQITPVVNKSVGDTLQISWIVTFLGS